MPGRPTADSTQTASAELVVRPLAPDTWDAFAQLVEANNGVWGGCWCMGVLGRPTDGPEQWQVVSDEPTGVETFAEYGERFQIEEGFLDDKSGLFGLEASRRRNASSLERLVLVIYTATLFLVSEGLQVVEQGLQRTVDPHWQRGLAD